MKFYDLEWLANKCGTDNKYEITVKVAAEARRESEEHPVEKGVQTNERYISNVLLEIEEGKSPINAHPIKVEDANTGEVTEVTDVITPEATEPVEQVEEQPVEEEAQEIDYGAVSGFAYGDDQIEQLRAAGYTGTEIENFQSQAMDFAQLMSKARADQKLFKLENDFNFYDIESDEFKSSVDNTWLSLPKRTDAEDFAENFAEYRVQDVNLDYEKVEPRGNQLFLKVYLDDNVHEDWFFLMVTPEEWAKLDDYGNVECEYTYATRYIGDNMYNLEVDPDTMYITEAHLNILEKYDYDSTDESTTN